MKEAWQKQAYVNIIDIHRDYLQDLARIVSPTFCPTKHDILRAHDKTTLGMMEQYQIDGIDFEIYEIDSKMYDVTHDKTTWYTGNDGAMPN
jgi:hypothetical protein